MEKKKLIYLTLVSIFLVLGAIYLLTQPKKDLKNNKNDEILNFNGSEILTLEPGDTKILSKNVLIRFGRTGTEFSVPDVIFGEYYTQNINYIPINNAIELYNNGRKVSLQKNGCTTKDVFTDIPERHIVDCKVDIKIEKSAMPEILKTEVNKVIKGSDRARPIYLSDYVMSLQGAMINENPLLYIGIPQFFIRNWNNSITGGPPGRSGSEQYELGFTVITNFGVAEILFIPSELFNEDTKNVQIGPANISITPQKNKTFGDYSNEDYTFQISMNFNDNINSYPLQILKFSY